MQPVVRSVQQPVIQPALRSAPQPAMSAASQPALRSAPQPAMRPPASAPPARLVDAVRGQTPPGAQITNPQLMVKPPSSKRPLIIIGITVLLAVAAAVVFFVVKPFGGGDGAGEGDEGGAIAAGPPVLSFASDPTGVEIFHDNRFIGETPIEHPVTAGLTEHKLQLATKANTFRVTVPAVEGPAWIYVQLPKDKAALGHVLVKSTPSGAEVKLGDKSIGKTPLVLVAADQTALDLQLEQGGKSQATQATAVAAGGQADVSF